MRASLLSIRYHIYHLNPMSSTERLLTGQETRCQLGQDGLFIIDQAITTIWSQEVEESTYYNRCLPSANVSPDITNLIPYHNILKCEQIDDNLYKINFVVHQGANVRLDSMVVTIDDVQVNVQLKKMTGYQDYILQKAYPNGLINPSILVIVNPFSGQGKALEIFHKEIKPVLEAAAVPYVLQETKYRYHAADIAKTLDIDKYDIVACVSGDGIPHEVINGFYQREDNGVSAFNKIAVTQLPGGSGNALTLSTHGSSDAAMSTFNMLKAKRTKMDLMAVKQMDGENEKVSLSFLSQCYGAIADSDIGTEHLRWMGPIRFDLGVAYKVFTRASYPCDLYVKYVTTTKDELLSHFDQHAQTSKDSSTETINKEHLSLWGPRLLDPVPSDWIQVDEEISSKLSIFYTGNMPYVSSDTPFFPAALPNDGSMDLIITSNTTPLSKAVSSLLLVESGKHAFDENVLHHKISGYRLVPRLPENSNHYISIDGENFPFKTMQVEILPGVLTSLLKDGNYTETCLKK